jgi:NADPH:quinone reductase
MKAIRVHQFGGADQLKLEDISDPILNSGEILVEIKAAGVNPVDTYIRNGTYSMKPALPYTPGFDGAGVVKSLGRGLPDWKIGDRVYTSNSLTGTYAQKCVCDNKHVHRLPDNVDFSHGAAVGIPYSTAYRALFLKAKSFPGETVLVHGASGGVGIAAVQLARAHGMLVLGTASTGAGRDLVLANGANHAIDHSMPGIVEAVLQHTGGRGVDVVIEMLANKNIPADLSVLAKRGRVVVVGNRGSVEVNFRDAMTRDACIQGMTIWNATDEERSRMHDALFGLLKAGVARPIVSRQFRLHDAAAAHETVMKSGNLGKLVLVT